MHCQTFQKQLTPYLDGVLADGARRALAEHAENCAACRELLDRSRVIDQALASLPRVTPRGSLAGQLHERIRRQPSRSRLVAGRWTRTISRYLPAAAILMAGLAVGGFLGSQILSDSLGNRAVSASDRTIQTAVAVTFDLGGVLSIADAGPEAAQ